MPAIPSPDELFPGLFDAVQTGHLFADSKTFVDATPKEAPASILAAWQQARQAPGFDLAAFVQAHFQLPGEDASAMAADPSRPVRQHIERLWDLLARQPDPQVAGASLLPLPQPYIVPGGRFREIYYWDSYFTMLGLAAAGRLAMIEHMVSNFAYLIDTVGFIPNGNRSYFCSRSQAPFFCLMVELLAETSREPAVYTRFLPQLQREYAFWMDGAEQLDANNPAHRRVIKVGDGFLNRYWDDAPRPRQESHLEDLELAQAAGRMPAELYRDVRAACESGWDFSSRWFADPARMATIRTTQVLPVDLNCLLHKLESVLAQACELAGNPAQAAFYASRAATRKELLQSLFFDQQSACFVDLLLPDLSPSPSLSLAGAFPLFLGLATPEQAQSVADKLKGHFLKSGGWVTTLARSGQQWDAPNGWAPLQWVVYRGLQDYGFGAEAQEGAQRWVNNNLGVYQATGKLVEKYNVEQVGLLAGGGEYQIQDGFGWTNGVLLCLLDELEPER